jgi:organic hydroperoxide reductase OsmC/OhrA
MQDFPHHYQVRASASTDGAVKLSASGLVSLQSAPPLQFGGHGDLWSPEDLLVAAVADCFVLSFRAVAGASGLAWTALECRVDGTLNRVDGVTRFTDFDLQATLTVSADIDPARALRLLQKAETNCLISNSLNAQIHLQCEIIPAV